MISNMPKKPHFRGLELGPLGRVGIIADSDGRRRRLFVHKRSSRRSRTTGKTKSGRNIQMVNYAVPPILSTPTTTWEQYSLCDITGAAGTETGRVSSDINLVKFKMRSQWFRGTATPWTRMRIVVCRIRAGTDPLNGLTIDTNQMYGRRLPDLKHVYFDRYIYYNGQNSLGRLNLSIPLKGAHIHFSDATSTSQDRDVVVMYSVCDTATSDGTFNGTARTTFVD